MQSSTTVNTLMANSSHIAPLAVSMGEPAGVGPELVARTWAEREKHELAPFIYVGSVEAINAVSPETAITICDTPADAFGVFKKALPAIEVPLVDGLCLGTTNPANGKSVVEAIDKAVHLARTGDCSGLVTAPIHKAALYSAGFDAPGHTEYLARLTGLPDEYSVMMLAAKNLKVVPVTIHVPLKEVPTLLTAQKIYHAGMVTAADLQRRFGIDRPKLAIAGLNPHAGEDGTIGMEEATHIMPAIWQLRDKGIDVTDPQSADTLFHDEARDNYDAVLCMYHDQALIPVKTLDFWGGVNVTLGLPFIRTSPDHGTALELAGKGKARIDSMVAAIKLAQDMAARETSHE
jgi:4-hydroxythreonine-4-phosphate dehydrogenase